MSRRDKGDEQPLEFDFSRYSNVNEQAVKRSYEGAADGMAVALAHEQRILEVIDEAVTGYLNKLLEQGWYESVAQSMALNYHGVVVERLRAK